MQTYEVEVVISKQEDGLWRAEVPGVPGCFVDEDTLEEAVQDIQEVIQIFIASYRDRGKSLPPQLRKVPLDSSLRLKIAVSAA